MNDRTPPKRSQNRWFITDKMFLSLFLTGTVIEFSQVGAGFIDGLMISRFLGTEAMAAEGIVHPVFSILGMISGLFAVGMQTRCAQAIGRGDRKEYSRFFSAAFYAGAIVSLIAAVLLVIFARPFAVLLGASGSAAVLADPAAEYLTGLSVGAPALIMTTILAPALQLDTGRKTIGTGALIEAVADIFLDIAAVKMGLGLLGMGLATAAASYLNLLYQCTFFLKKDRILHFVRPAVPFREFIKILANGSEKAVRRLANTLRPVILNAVIISYGGTAAMSALSMRNNFSNFTEIFGAGIASAVALLTGVYYGERNAEGIEEVCKQKQRTILLFPCTVSVLMMVFAKQIARLYLAGDGEIYDMTVFAIRSLALQIPLQAQIESRIKYLQAVQKRHNMNLLTIVTRLVFVILSAVLLGKLLGKYGILMCYTVSDALTLLTIYGYYTFKCGKARPLAEDYLNLPNSFRLHPGDVISLDIQSQEDVSLASEQIMLFCAGHGIDHRTAYHAALSFEELVSDTICYGFPVTKAAKPMADLRVVTDGDTLVIRIRDNCVPYNITEKIAAAVNDKSDPMRDIGIRIISKTASDITYLNTFNTNNLILSFSRVNG